MNFSAATTLTLDATVSGTLDPAASTTLYQFSGTAGSTILFDAFTDSNSNPDSVVDNVTLLDQYGNSLYTGNLNTSSGRLTLPSTGPYTLVVQGSLFNTGTTSYSFDVQPVNDVTTPLTLGTAVSGSIATPGQNQNYTFTLSTATRLWFDSQTDDGSLTWALNGPEGTAYNSIAFTDDDQNIGLLQPGTYTLSVSGSGTYTGSYTFNLLNFSAATTLTPSTTVNGVCPFRMELCFISSLPMLEITIRLPTLVVRLRMMEPGT